MRRTTMQWALGVVAIATTTALTAATLPASAQPNATPSTSAAATSKAPDLGNYAKQKLTWGTCVFDTAEDLYQVDIECAQLTVPRDWAKPDAGVDLKVHVSRVKADGPSDQRLGVIITNPGGPGGQGADLPALFGTTQPALHARYDLLGMDPRGTGTLGVELGKPGALLTCDVPIERLPAGPLDGRDRSAKSIKAHQDGTRAIAEACQSEAVSPYLTTWQTAHDLELYRQLIKEKKLNYVGYSYGSWLGAKYASMFPEQSGRMVLDSSVDFQGRLMADFEDFPRMGQRQSDDSFIPWLTRQAPEVFGKTVPAAKAKLEKARKEAIKSGIDPNTFDAFFVGNGNSFGWIFNLVILAALVEGTPLPELGGLSAAERALLEQRVQERFGVPVGKLDRAIVIKNNLGEPDRPEDYLPVPLTRFAVACNDQVTKSTGWYKKLSDTQGPKYSYFGWQYGLTEVCGPWTDAPRQQLPNLPASVRDRVLVVQSELDPQTSYEQAMAGVRKAPGVNVLRIDDSPFHGQYALQNNFCVDGIVNNFLINNSVADNALCSSVPLPGEDSIVAVDGPVDDYLDGRRPARRQSAPADSPQDKARLLIGERIAKINS